MRLMHSVAIAFGAYAVLVPGAAGAFQQIVVEEKVEAKEVSVHPQPVDLRSTTIIMAPSTSDSDDDTDDNGYQEIPHVVAGDGYNEVPDVLT